MVLEDIENDLPSISSKQMKEFKWAFITQEVHLGLLTTCIFSVCFWVLFPRLSIPMGPAVDDNTLNITLVGWLENPTCKINAYQKHV